MTEPSSSSKGNQPGSFVPPSVEELNTVLDAYEFIEILGYGGMGAVYKVCQSSLNRIAAIKILPQFDSDDGHEFAERFQREARAMGKLSHPNIISVYDFGQTSNGLLYIVMEYVEGRDLNQLLRAGELSTDHLYSWIPQICEALQYAHSQGIVHRDIKPANIMIDQEGTVKIADFGLAKLNNADGQMTQLTMANVAMGTPDYVAPEALEYGVETDHRADIYAVGVMIYEMLTGKIPRGAWHPPSKVNPQIDVRFDELVVKAMDADRDSRFQNASEINAHLSSMWTTDTTHEPVMRNAEVDSGARRSGANTVGIPKSKKQSLVVGGLIAAVLVVGGLITYLSGNRDDSQESAMGIANRSNSTEMVIPVRSVKKESINDPPISEPSPAGKILIDERAEGESQGNGMKSTKGPESAEVVGNLEGSAPIKEREPAAVKPESKALVAQSPEVAETLENKMVGAAAAEIEAMPESEAAAKIKGILTRYEEGYRETMLSKHEAAVSDLNTNYSRALKRQMDAAVSAGNLEEVIAIRSEIGRVNEGETLADSDEGFSDKLGNMRNTYRSEIGRLEQDHMKTVATLVTPLDQAFARLEGELTRAGKVDAALEVRDARVLVKSEGIPFVSFSSDELMSAIDLGDIPGSGNSQSGRTTSLSSKQDRDAAAWVLSMGGKVTLVLGDKEVSVEGSGEGAEDEMMKLLPDAAFQLVEVRLSESPSVNDGNVGRFPSAPNLKRLYMDKLQLNESSSFRIIRRFPRLEVFYVPYAKADEWVKEFDNIQTLRIASFYRTTLTDDGMRDLSRAIWITELSLTDTGITERCFDDLCKLVNLKVLRMSNFRGETKDDDLAKLKALRNLEGLELLGASWSEEGIAALKAALPSCVIRYSVDGSAKTLE